MLCCDNLTVISASVNYQQILFHVHHVQCLYIALKFVKQLPAGKIHNLISRINFEERWLKASKPHGLKKLKTSYDDALLRIERETELLGVNTNLSLVTTTPKGGMFRLIQIWFQRILG